MSEKSHILLCFRKKGQGKPLHYTPGYAVNMPKHLLSFLAYSQMLGHEKVNRIHILPLLLPLTMLCMCQTCSLSLSLLLTLLFSKPPVPSIYTQLLGLRNHTTNFLGLIKSIQSKHTCTLISLYEISIQGGTNIPPFS